MNYIIIATNKTTMNAFAAIVTAETIEAAKRDFLEIYRHGIYTILSVTQIPNEYRIIKRID